MIARALPLRRGDPLVRRSRLGAACVVLLAAFATLGVKSALATTAGSLFPSALELRLPANAAAPGAQDESFPTSTQNAELGSVSCTSNGNCIAVGTYTVDNHTGNEETMVATERSGAWEAAVEINVPIVAVACTGPGHCVGVGGDEVAAQSKSGWGKAHKLRLPKDVLITSGRPRAHLYAVSCTSAGNCVAAGTYTDRLRRVQAIAATQSKGVWGAAHGIAPPANALTAPGRQHDELSSVACTSTGNCIAVGSYRATSGSEEQAMLTTETHGAWAPASELALPANAVATASKQEATLNSVTCTSTGNCIAVGSYNDSGGDSDAMAASETSGAWQPTSEIPPPATAGAAAGQQFGGLNSAACVSAGNCIAVGEYFASNQAAQQELQGGAREGQTGTQEPLAAAETNGVWGAASATVLPGDALSEPGGSSLASVACTHGSGGCVAVGTYVNDCSPETNTCQVDGSGAMVLGQHLRRG